MYDVGHTASVCVNQLIRDIQERGEHIRATEGDAAFRSFQCLYMELEAQARLEREADAMAAKLLREEQAEKTEARRARSAKTAKKRLRKERLTALRQRQATEHTAAGPSADDASPCTPPTPTPPTHDTLKAFNALTLDTETASTIGASQCCICMENDKSVLLLPCRHLCVCVSCYNGSHGRQPLQSCPICRARVEDTVFVYS